MHRVTGTDDGQLTLIMLIAKEHNDHFTWAKNAKRRKRTENGKKNGKKSF